MLSKHSITQLCPSPVYSSFFLHVWYVCAYVCARVCLCACGGPQLVLRASPISLSLSPPYSLGGQFCWTHSSPFQLVLLAGLLQGFLSPPSEAGIKSRWQHPPGIRVSYGDCILTVSLPILLAWCFPSPLITLFSEYMVVIIHTQGFLLGLIAVWFCFVLSWRKKWGGFPCKGKGIAGKVGTG